MQEAHGTKDEERTLDDLEVFQPFLKFGVTPFGFVPARAVTKRAPISIEEYQTLCAFLTSTAPEQKDACLGHFYYVPIHIRMLERNPEDFDLSQAVHREALECFKSDGGSLSLKVMKKWYADDRKGFQEWFCEPAEFLTAEEQQAVYPDGLPC